MAFEYSSQNQSLNFPNPLRFHNWALVGAAAIVIAAAVALLWSAREALEFGHFVSPYPAIGVALLMVMAAVSYLYSCLAHLRFYFGRGRPRGLAAQLAAEGQGSSPEAEQIVKESLRQQAIEYREPAGPIAGLLYSLVPNLIYAPAPLRRLAEWQFRGLVTLVTLLVGLLVTLAIGLPGHAAHSAAVADWIGVAFLVAALWTLLRPAGVEIGGQSFLSAQWISLLIVFALVGPVVLSLLAPALPPVPLFAPFPHVFFFLLAGIAVHGLAFTAILRQLLPPPATAVSMIQETWNLSNNPGLVSAEFLRAMQESWRDKIPNRRYVRIEPEIDLAARAGNFRGELIEETQPFPYRINADSPDQVAPSGSPLLVQALDLVALVFLAGAAAAAFLAGRDFLAGQVPALTGLYALFAWAVAGAALGGARRLWLRFDFQSRVYWLEMQGQYVSGTVDQGNVIQGNLRASSSMVQVEGMTFRLWVAELHTVSFGKDASRHIVAMWGNGEVAEGLAARLRQFAAGQASVAALGTSANAERLAVNNALASRVASLPANGIAGIVALSQGAPTPEDGAGT